MWLLLVDHFFWVQQHPMLVGCPMHTEGITALSSRGSGKTVAILLWRMAGWEQRHRVCVCGGGDSKGYLTTAASTARCGCDLRSQCPGKRCDGHLPGQPTISM